MRHSYEEVYAVAKELWQKYKIEDKRYFDYIVSCNILVVSVVCPLIGGFPNFKTGSIYKEGDPVGENDDFHIIFGISKELPEGLDLPEEYKGIEVDIEIKPSLFV